MQLYLTFVAGAGLLGISTAFNAITDHGTCTAVFVLVGAILNIAISSIQTLDKISWLGWVGLIGILSSVITLAIAVSLQDRPSAAPLAPLPWSPGVVTIGNPSFTEGAAACANIIFSFAGTPNFFNVVSEMREPKHYYRAMYTCQTVVTLAYLVIGSLVYKFCGQYVASPALGSAGPLLKKVWRQLWHRPPDVTSHADSRFAMASPFLVSLLAASSTRICPQSTVSAEPLTPSKHRG